MKLALNLVLFVVLAIGTSQIATAQGSSPRSGTTITDISTMFARDPLTQSLCLKDGGPGGAFESGQTRNRCSDLNFNSYVANGFSVGVEGGRVGVILDLGTPEDLVAKYGFSETVGHGQGFASIDVKNGKALILKDYKTGKLQDLAESAQLFQSPSDKSASLPVKLGHVYLLRITDTRDKAFEMLAKFIVVAHVANESVTVRWNLISKTAMAKL